MRTATIALMLCACACGDNLAGIGAGDAGDARPPAIDAAPDAPGGEPDLTLIGAQMDNSILVTSDTFAADSCEVVEQCVGAAGGRVLLRFDTVTANLGDADVIVGMPPSEAIDEGPWTWSPCHGHHHLSGYATYELLDAGGVVISGHKQAFCLRDSQQARPGAPSQGYNCGNQGLSAGWADIYGRALPCQWIDVTGVPAGTYTLRVEINPLHTFPDSDLTNNVYERAITL